MYVKKKMSKNLTRAFVDTCFFFGVSCAFTIHTQAARKRLKIILTGNGYIGLLNRVAQSFFPTICRQAYTKYHVHWYVCALLVFDDVQACGFVFSLCRFCFTSEVDRSHLTELENDHWNAQINTPWICSIHIFLHNRAVCRQCRLIFCL